MHAFICWWIWTNLEKNSLSTTITTRLTGCTAFKKHWGILFCLLDCLSLFVTPELFEPPGFISATQAAQVFNNLMLHWEQRWSEQWGEVAMWKVPTIHKLLPFIMCGFLTSDLTKSLKVILTHITTSGSYWLAILHFYYYLLFFFNRLSLESTWCAQLLCWH